MTSNDFKKKLKIAMVDADITQEQLAKLLKTTQSQISKWLTGERNPKASSLKKIAEATDKPLNYFFDNSKNTSDISGRNNIVGNESKNITQIIGTGEVSKIALLEKEIEILKLQMELLKKDKKK
jgi:transcriptional regulator with XRE-family HTH domain